MGRDRFQRFIGTQILFSSTESEAELEKSDTENEQPNESASERRNVRRSARLTIQSDDESEGCSDGIESNMSGTHVTFKNHGNFASQQKGASRHFDRSSDQGPKQPVEVRQSARLSSKRPYDHGRPFYLDELEGSDDMDTHTDYECEERA